jgi:class 3 adenylate cyclase
MRGVTEWLESIGLSEYAQRFAENGVDLSVLRDLTDQDLKDLGVLLGHRRKILRAIAELEDGARFKSAVRVAEPTRTDQAERRHLTVMFCDLVGSTSLAARLDPEDMRALIGAYHTCITEVVRRYQGKIARYMGDGALVYFGYPQAHEDDAEQAVRAALALVVAIANIRDVVAPLKVRVGIATGTVVVTELMIESTPAEQAVVGETPNLAARLQAMAEPGTVLICASTRSLTRGEFHYRDFAPVSLKGWAEPVRVYQVLGMSGVESRFEALHAAKLPALFGREEEIELLVRRWRQAAHEEGRVVTLMYGPAVRCKRFRRSGRCGLASMYPTSVWSALCSGSSWISARIRSDYRTGLDRAIWVTSVRVRREDRSPSSSHPLADLGGQTKLHHR